MSPGTLSPAAETLLRELAPRVLGAIVRRHGDFASAEDAVQEALLAAWEEWPARGVPENPGGWLYRVACRRLEDRSATRPPRPSERRRRRRWSRDSTTGRTTTR
jgi:predicted RNA polymerase sigma factor